MNIFVVFYDPVSYERDGDSWRRAFNPDSYQMKLTQDLVDAESGEVAAEAGTKLNPRALRKIEEKGLSFIKAEDYDIIGNFMARDIVDMSNGIVIAEAGDEITEELLLKLTEMDYTVIDVLGIDINVGPHLRNTLAQTETAGRSASRYLPCDASGEPPT